MVSFCRSRFAPGEHETVSISLAVRSGVGLHSCDCRSAQSAAPEVWHRKEMMAPHRPLPAQNKVENCRAAVRPWSDHEKALERKELKPERPP